MIRLAQLCMIITIAVLSMNSEQTERSVFTELCELMETDLDGNQYSHMWLAASHGFDVSPDGIVIIDGRRYEIWPGVHEIA